VRADTPLLAKILMELWTSTGNASVPPTRQFSRRSSQRLGMGPDKTLECANVVLKKMGIIGVHDLFFEVGGTLGQRIRNGCPPHAQLRFHVP